METSPITVVAVIVTRNPGSSFEDTLASLAAQDFGSLPILVIDDGSREPVTNRVAQVVPSAFVRRFDAPIGYAAAANQSLSMVQGAAYLLYCHDDVAFAPDAVRLLAAEAQRSGAAMVTPKIVAWNAHDRLLSLGAQLDRIGTSVATVEPFELDQGQHDGVREVIHAPGAAVLVQAAALTAIGGFDEGTTDPRMQRLDPELAGLGAMFGPDLGEDVDLSWRMKQHAFSVTAQPMARVAHLGTLHGSFSGNFDAPTGSTSIAKQVTSARETNRLRTMLTTASAVRLPFEVAVLFVRSLLHVVMPSRSGASSVGFAPWRSVFRNHDSVREQRKLVQKLRLVGDRELLANFPPLGARTRASLRAEATAEGALVWNAAERVVAGRSRLARLVVVGTFAFVAIALIGSRGFLRNGIPSIGQFAPWPSLRGLFGAAFSEWRPAGLGVGAPAAPGTFLLAGVTAVFFGKGNLAQTISMLAMLPVGALGMWRLMGLLASDRGDDQGDGQVDVEADVRGAASGAAGTVGGAGTLAAKVASTATYLVAPVFYDGLVAGRFDALVAYGLLPWLLRRLVLRRENDVMSPSRVQRLVDAIVVGVPLAVVVALAPTLLPVVVLLVVGWVLGSFASGLPTSATFLLRRVTRGCVAATVLLAPWILDLVFGSGSSSRLDVITGGDQAAQSRLRVLDLFRMAAGPIGRHPFSWAFPVIAILSLLVADGARFRNAVRSWMLVVVSVAILWVTSRGWVPILVPSEHVVLVLVALGLAIATGLGIAGVQRDARSRSFGWRQTFGVGASVVIVGLFVPVIANAGPGRWNLPERTVASELRWLNDKAAEGGYRIAWLGSPRILPSAGWRLADDLALTLSDDGLPSVLGMYGARSTPALDQLVNYIRDASARKTARLGAHLAPYAVRYLIVVERAWDKGPFTPIPGALRSALLDQLDLRQLEVSPGVLLLENTQWVPTYAAVPGRPEISTSLGGPTVFERRSIKVDLAGAQPVLLSNRSEEQLADDASVALNDPEQARRDAQARRNDLVAGTELRGRVPPISTFTVAVAADDRWRARGATFDESPIVLGTGTMAFAPTGVSGSNAGGPAVGAQSSVDVVALEYQSPPMKRLFRAFEGMLWFAALLMLLRSRRSHRSSREVRLLTTERAFYQDHVEESSGEFGDSLGFDADEFEASDGLDGVRMGDVRVGHVRVAGAREGNRLVNRVSKAVDRTGSSVVPAADPSSREPSITSLNETSLTSSQAASPRGVDSEGVDQVRVVGVEGDAEAALSSAADRGIANATDDGDLMLDGSLADALWETWSRRRESREDPLREVSSQEDPLHHDPVLDNPRRKRPEQGEQQKRGRTDDRR